MNITGIGKLQAKEGYEYSYLGPSHECDSCKYKNACITLEIGKKYKITKVRDITHDCPVHYSEIKIVEVEKVKDILIVERTQLTGSIIKFVPYPCTHVECQYWSICRGVGITPNTSFKITSIETPIECPIGRSLKKVVVE